MVGSPSRNLGARAVPGDVCWAARLPAIEVVRGPYPGPLAGALWCCGRVGKAVGCNPSHVGSTPTSTSKLFLVSRPGGDAWLLTKKERGSSPRRGANYAVKHTGCVAGLPSHAGQGSTPSSRSNNTVVCKWSKQAGLHPVPSGSRVRISSAVPRLFSILGVHLSV